MDQPAEKSALIVPVLEAEKFVRKWRKNLDPACFRGIPAHITVLFPFAHPTDLDEEMITSLDDYFSRIDPFDFVLNEVAWFENRVVYLEPLPDTAFRDMTRDLLARFPQYLPYDGKFGEPKPHLTVGDGAPTALLEEAASDISQHLPIVVNAKKVWLMTGGMGSNSWTLRHDFSLGHSPI